MRALCRALVLLLVTLALHLGAVSPASAAGDDYPWRLDRTGSADDYGFTKRQCVSFVAWRLAQRRAPLSNATQQWGHARDWDDAARRLGVRIGRAPVVGAVAHWNAGESSPFYASGSARPNGRMSAGSFGHVAYVQRVHADGSVTVAHYNSGGHRTYSEARVRAPRYLYIGLAVSR